MAFAEASLAETAFAESAVPQSIIPEVTVETRHLVFVVEIDVIRPVPPAPVATFSDGTLWDDGSGWVD